MTTYETSPACFARLLNAAQTLRDAGVLPPDASDVRVAQFTAAITECTDAVAEAQTLRNYIDQAREQTNDDLEIDDSPLTSAGEDGVWVAAWVHVRHPVDYHGEAEAPEVRS